MLQQREKQTKERCAGAVSYALGCDMTGGASPAQPTYHHPTTTTHNNTQQQQDTTTQQQHTTTRHNNTQQHNNNTTTTPQQHNNNTTTTHNNTTTITAFHHHGCCAQCNNVTLGVRPPIQPSAVGNKSLMWPYHITRTPGCSTPTVDNQHSLG